jgi:hypothetical protein
MGEMHMSTTLINDTLGEASIGSDWPVDAQAAALALETAFPPLIDRRRTPRVRHRTTAAFHPADRHPEAPSHTLYTRDTNPWQLGFIASRPLSVGQRGCLELELPNGRTVHIECTVRRCREFLDGWYEGVVHFRHEQPDLGGK